jgi:hypothetical protein
MISRGEIVGIFRWFDIESLTDEVSEQEIWACHCGLNSTQCLNFREAWRIQQSANVSWPTQHPFFSTPLLLVSLAEHLTASRMSLQIVAVKRRHGCQQLSITIHVLQRFLSSLWVSEAEKSINMSSTPAICSTIWSLDYAKSSRLVSESLDKFSPTQYGISTVLTFIEYIADQQVRQCLWKIWFPADALPFTPAA